MGCPSEWSAQLFRTRLVDAQLATSYRSRLASEHRGSGSAGACGELSGAHFGHGGSVYKPGLDLERQASMQSDHGRGSMASMHSMEFGSMESIRKAHEGKHQAPPEFGSMESIRSGTSCGMAVSRTSTMHTPLSMMRSESGLGLGEDRSNANVLKVMRSESGLGEEKNKKSRFKLMKAPTMRLKRLKSVGSRWNLVKNKVKQIEEEQAQIGKIGQTRSQKVRDQYDVLFHKYQKIHSHKLQSNKLHPLPPREAAPKVGHILWPSKTIVHTVMLREHFVLKLFARTLR